MQYYNIPSGTDMINSATANGANAKKQEWDTRNNPVPLTSGLLGDAKSVVNGILANKKSYDFYDAAANNAAQALQTEQDENTRAELQKQYALATQGKNEVARDTQTLRNIGSQLGFNQDLMNRYGSDVTLADAQNNYQLDSMRALQDLYHSKSSDSVYNDTYRMLRDRGISDDRANEYAGRAAANYKAERLASLQDGLQSYGLDSDGAINPAGMELLSLLGGEDTDTGNMILNAYANPKNAYATNVAKQAAEMANQYKMQGLDKEAAINQNMQKVKAYYDMIAQQQKNQHDFDVMAAKYGYEAALKKLGAGSANGRNNGSSSGGGSGNSNNSQSGKGSSKSPTISDSKTIIEMRDKWNADNPGNEAANPYNDAAEAAQNNIDNYFGEDFQTPDNYQSAYHNAQKVMEENYRRGYQLNADGLRKMIRSVTGPYADSVIKDFDEDGAIEKYSG